jgi:ABC-type transport system involved in multi-copper enzyme maturation permease subunit
MVGPVFALELLREQRRSPFYRILPLGYAALVGAQLLGFLLEANNTVLRAARASLVPTVLLPARLTTLVIQHFVVLFVVTGAVAATAFSEEKAKGILADLLTTALTSAEIVLGKLLGRSLRALEVVLAGLPLLCAAGAYTGLSPLFFVAFLWVTVLAVVTATAVGLALAVGSRHTSGAVVGTYLVIGAWWLSGRWVPVLVLDPVEALAPFWGQPDVRLALAHLLQTSVAWGAMAAACFGLATVCLRIDSLRQVQGGGRRRRAWGARRPPVDDDPIRWKENHIDGLAPLAMLRRVPRLCGVVLVVVGTSLAGAAIYISAANRRGGFHPLAFLGLGVAFVLAASLVVTVRCATAISGERERLTWESLYLTGIDGEEVVYGKLRGVMDAAMPYLLAYAIPVFMIALSAGPEPALVTVANLIVAVPFLYYAAACGLQASANGNSTWRSLAAALFAVYITGPLLCVAVHFGLGICCFFGCANLAYQQGLGGVPGMLASVVVLLVPIANLVILVLLGRAMLRRAARRVFPEPQEPMAKPPVQQRKSSPGE